MDPIYSSLQIDNHNFPGVWQYMFPKQFGKFKFPKEAKAACLDCPKIKSENFRPDYRCCTYFPRVPNFLLGLAMKTPLGKRKVEELVTKKHLIPEGYVHTPLQWIDYLRELKDDNFGQGDLALCPFLDRDSGYCSIHAFRNSVCATFFCYHDNGKKGENFWNEIQQLGSQAETAICQWALDELGFDFNSYIEALNSLSKNLDTAVNKRTRSWSTKALKMMWGEWYGKEIVLLEKCAELISENRNQLWKIACKKEIIEAPQYDQAMIAYVPNDLKSEIDETDLVDGESVSCQELWSDCLDRYRKLKGKSKRP